MRMRKKKNLLPRMERCGAYQIKDPYERKGRWHDLMPEAKEIRVELGCGKSLEWINSMQEGTINLARRKLMKEG